MLDSGATYHVCSRREWFSNFENLGEGVIMGNDHTCQMVGIGTIRIKMFDRVVRELTEVIYSSNEEESYLSWSHGVKGAQCNHGEWNSQDHKRVYGYERCQR